MNPAIIWTRSLSDWEKDKSLFSESKSVVHLPATEIRPLHLTTDLNECETTLVSSTKTVSVLKSHNSDALKKIQKNPNVYCFGKKTYESLIDCAIKAHLISSCKSLAELSQWVVNNLEVTGVSYLGTKSPAFDLELFFSKHSIKFTHYACYTINHSKLHHEIRAQIDKFDRLLICLASPSAVQSLLPIPESKNVDFLCIGDTTARTLKAHGVSCNIAEQHSIDSLAQLAFEWYKHWVTQD